MQFQAEQKSVKRTGANVLEILIWIAKDVGLKPSEPHRPPSSKPSALHACIPQLFSHVCPTVL